MRMIGHVNGDAQARAFTDYLLVQGIDNEAEHERDGKWAIWIHAEEEQERAKALLAEFLQNPADSKYAAAAEPAADARRRAQQDQASYEKRVRKRRHLFRPMGGYSFGPVSFILMFICGVVFYIEYVNRFDVEAIMPFFIAKFRIAGDYIYYDRTLSEIRNGEVWRLFTPMFLHFSWLHIICNMLWLQDLGSMIEARQKSWLLVVMVFSMAAVSNLVQFFFGGPNFGGMSGVVYGLLGYVWIRGKFDPGSGLYLHPQTVTMMIVWFFACIFASEYIGPIANWAHGGGLAMGMLWGWLSSLRYR